LCAPLAAQTDILHLKSDVADTIFGQIVPDPYRWMEDLNSDSVKQWLSAQRKITHKEKLKFRQSLDLAENNLDLYAAYNVPAAQKVGPWYFSMGSYPLCFFIVKNLKTNKKSPTIRTK
jgi:prolyl oligopeptidase PreP (S9A serine peptidase family)